MPAEPRGRSPSARGRDVIERVVRRMSHSTERIWTRGDIARVLLDALVETGFDWRQPSALKEIKRLLMATYRIAWQTMPAERLRLAERPTAARAGREVSL